MLNQEIDTYKQREQQIKEEYEKQKQDGINEFKRRYAETIKSNTEQTKHIQASATEIIKREFTANQTITKINKEKREIEEELEKIKRTLTEKERTFENRLSEALEVERKKYESRQKDDIPQTPSEIFSTFDFQNLHTLNEDLSTPHLKHKKPRLSSGESPRISPSKEKKPLKNLPTNPTVVTTPAKKLSITSLPGSTPRKSLPTLPSNVSQPLMIQPKVRLSLREQALAERPTRNTQKKT